MTTFVVLILFLIGIGGKIDEIISLSVIHDSLDKVDLSAGTKKEIMNW